MSITIPRGATDSILEQIVETLESYKADHPGSEIALYRQNSVSVRIRIIDPAFAGKNRIERSDLVWRYIEKLPDDVQSDISTLILLTADETKRSFANFEFEDPVPSSF